MEAGGVQLATLTDLSLEWRLAREGFPVFFFALVRVWSALGLGASDFTLRILGFVIGLGLLGGIWLNARLMGFRLPFISLGLLAANLTLVRWGDSLRAYGFGSLFILLTLV
jgi:predicted membrane-bound mannosyltransferase